MNEIQKSKILTDIPDMDIAIKMGCNVVYPVLTVKHVEDWGIEDPTGKYDKEFIKIARIIEEKNKRSCN
jgi:arsenate reductase (thioredoxin)